MARYVTDTFSTCFTPEREQLPACHCNRQEQNICPSYLSGGSLGQFLHTCRRIRGKHFWDMNIAYSTAHDISHCYVLKLTERIVKQVTCVSTLHNIA